MLNAELEWKVESGKCKVSELRCDYKMLTNFGL